MIETIIATVPIRFVRGLAGDFRGYSIAEVTEIGTALYGLSGWKIDLVLESTVRFTWQYQRYRPAACDDAGGVVVDIMFCRVTDDAADAPVESTALSEGYVLDRPKDAAVARFNAALVDIEQVIAEAEATVKADEMKGEAR